MSTFLSEREHTARKRHCCDECTTMIAVGERYAAQAYVDGEFRVYKAHVECREAQIEYLDLCGIGYDDDPSNLCNGLDTREDREWILEKHPIVAERLGIKAKVAA